MEELEQEQVIEPEEVETEESTTSEEEVQVEDATAEVAEEPHEEPKKSGVQKRINELTRARHDAERRAEAAEKRYHETLSKPQVENTTSESPPVEDNFDTYEDFIKEQARYEARQEFRSLKQQDEAQQKAAKQKETEQQFAGRVEKLKSNGNMKYDDFEEVTRIMPLTKDTLSAAMESDVGDDILYFLGNNLDEAERIAGLSVHGQALAIGRLEAKMKQPTKKTTKAPAPIDPVSTTGMTGKVDIYSPNIDDDAFSKEFRKRRQRLRGY